MGYDGAGLYTRTHNFSADASAGIKILALRMDAEFNDFASAMSLPLLRDGRNAATGDIPMGGHRLVNVGGPASASNFMRSKDFIENVPIYMVDAELSADRISVSASFFTTASAATAPRDGSHILVKAGSDKSSAVAIRLNTGDGSPHSAGVVLGNGSAIYSGAIRSGGIYEFLWSSSDAAWQLFNPQVDYAASAYPGVILLATAAEVAAGTDVPKAVTPSQLASKFSASYATVTSAGLVELATTAEVVAGTDVFVAITPSTLHAYVSAATPTSAGILEIATTAEASAGTDTTRAITPATLRARQAAFAVIAVGSVQSVTFLTKSYNATGWSAEISANGVAVFHQIGLTSANAACINLQVQSEIAADRRAIPQIFRTSTSSFNFDFIEASTVTSQAFFPVSVNVHIQVMY